jgi:hypothetical protein
MFSKQKSYGFHICFLRIFEVKRNFIVGKMLAFLLLFNIFTFVSVADRAAEFEKSKRDPWPNTFKTLQAVYYRKNCDHFSCDGDLVCAVPKSSRITFRFPQFCDRMENLCESKFNRTNDVTFYRIILKILELPLQQCEAPTAMSLTSKMSRSFFYFCILKNFLDLSTRSNINPFLSSI